MAWHAHACAHDTCMRSLACACALLCLAHSDSICSSLLSAHLLAMYVTHTGPVPHDARRRVSATSAPPIITLSTHEHTISQTVSVCGLWLGMRTHAHMTHACALSHAHARFCAWLILIPFAHRFCLLIFLPCMSHTRGRFHMMRVVVSRPHRRRPSSRSRHTNTRSRRL